METDQIAGLLLSARIEIICGQQRTELLNQWHFSQMRWNLKRGCRNIATERGAVAVFLVQLQGAITQHLRHAFGYIPGVYLQFWVCNPSSYFNRQTK